MKIIADEKIPFVEHYFQRLGELILLPARDITQQRLIDADVLLIRSVTAVTQHLLEKTAIQFVGTTSVGVDHLDTAWLQKAGIPWHSATGCNASAVVDFVVCVIAALQQQGFLRAPSLRAGIIGVGNIGRRILPLLRLLGFDCIYHDPLRAQQESDFVSTPLTEFKELDLITLHTPLTTTGDAPTYHMINHAFLQQQKENCVLVNTARGSVIDSAALALYGQTLINCLDVWEQEPDIDFELLQQATIATPHIAGYAIEARQRATQIIFHALQQSPLGKTLQKTIAQPTIAKKKLQFANKHCDWQEIVLANFDPRVVTTRMQQTLMENPAAFEAVRFQFAGRHELSNVEVHDVIITPEHQKILIALGITLHRSP